MALTILTIQRHSLYRAFLVWSTSSTRLSVATISIAPTSVGLSIQLNLDKPACLKVNQHNYKYWDVNAIQLIPLFVPHLLVPVATIFIASAPAAHMHLNICATAPVQMFRPPPSQSIHNPHLNMCHCINVVLKSVARNIRKEPQGSVRMSSMQD